MVFVIARIPAGYDLAKISKSTGMIVAVSPTGTIWNGSATDIILKQGRKEIHLGRTHWTLSKLRLLTGKIGIDLKSYEVQMIQYTYLILKILMLTA